MSSDDGLITGSARSVKEFNIYDGIDSCADLLEHFGGHKYAAGLTMKQENLEEFSQRFEEYVKENLDESSYEPEITVDMMLKLSEITPQFLKNLKKFAPFGPGNMEPVFETDGVVGEVLSMALPLTKRPNSQSSATQSPSMCFIMWRRTVGTIR